MCQEALSNMRKLFDSGLSCGTLNVCCIIRYNEALSDMGTADEIIIHPSITMRQT